MSKDELDVLAQMDTVGQKIEARMAERAALLSALKKLRNEIAGALSIGLSDCIGNTNAACLRLRIKDADEAIAKAEGR